MAYAIQYDPNSAPVTNRVTRFVNEIQPMDWSARPNTLIDPPVSAEASAANYANCRWNGTTVVALTAEELASEADAARKASWESRTVGYFNTITQRTTDRI